MPQVLFGQVPQDIAIYGVVLKRTDVLLESERAQHLPVLSGFRRQLNFHILWRGDQRNPF
ncbi:hypothetical protein USDA257_c23690 [Sinorhizobium fredii USDA 257]|uniref:Uncharacterized protein n=1 Tax=Sinorhizobium fredii (strain USDA 257) TaxID=1185652 RepID=I3X4Z0_SINF2|nr:hypothetical protein USDA257_c23690 [Sinorhizobium fredii USDA 257]